MSVLLVCRPVDGVHVRRGSRHVARRLHVALVDVVVRAGGQQRGQSAVGRLADRSPGRRLGPPLHSRFAGRRR